MRVKGNNIHNTYQFMTSQDLFFYICNKISRKPMKIDFKNSPKMELCDFEIEIWNARLRLCKDAMITIFTKI